MIGWKRVRYIALCFAVFGSSACSVDPVTPTPDPTEPDHEIPEYVEITEFDITGLVVDDDELPVAEAMVLQGGRPDSLVLTGTDGRFTLSMVNPGYGNVTVVATKPGFRASGLEFMSYGRDVTLMIREIKGPDNEEYIFQEPGDGQDSMQEDCSHCHTQFVQDFLASKHAEAAKNPLLHDLYAGVNRAVVTQSDCELAGGRWLQGKEPGSESTLMMRCYLGGGVLADLNTTCGAQGQLACDDPGLSAENMPTAFGACADCHAPGIDGQLGGRDLGEATGLAYDKGVHCDVCHKVTDIDMSKPPGVGQRLVMGRPSEPGRNTYIWDPVYYGPILDVPNVLMGGSYQPKFNDAVFCAGCHEQNQEALIPGEVLELAKFPDGLPVHTTYSEWQAGPYNNEATPCQFCHMPETHGKTNAVDIATLEKESITFGFRREPSDIRQHSFRGPLQGEPRLIDEALYVSLRLDQNENQVSASVSVSNVGCGHAVPTGEPMRSLVMVVEAEGDNCGELEATAGMTIQEEGGAYLKGVVGETVTANGAQITWNASSGKVTSGMTVRAVKPTGTFDDYKGIGYFGEESLTAEAKGLEIFSPAGRATVISVEGDLITLDGELMLAPGDVLYLGDAWTGQEADGEASKHLAGLSGYTFAKILIDSSGNRQVPHYKAVDMLRDNRIAPGGKAITVHSFDLPQGCDVGTVQAKVLYRPRPLSQAILRGWDARDYTIASGAARFGVQAD